jgi:hemoglobin-like flavoprotein
MRWLGPMRSPVHRLLGIGSPRASHEGMDAAQLTEPNRQADASATMNIHESLHHVLHRDEILADLFYDVFLDRYPEVREFFEGVDLQRQALLLTMALVVVVNHYTNAYPATELYLKYLGTQHHRRGIPVESYASFREALLETLERFHGDDWSPELAGNWRAAIDLAATTMHDGYREDFAV